MKRKNIKVVLKEYFYMFPSVKMRVRQLERTLNLPLPSIIRYCRELESEKILRRQVIGNVTFYTSNRVEEFFLEKKLFNIKSLHESGLLNFLKIELSNPVIILFGSYARGEDVESSDIDLYIETLSKKKLNLKKYEEKLSRNIHIFEKRSIKQIKNKHLVNNILNGITLNNQIEVF